MNRQPTHKLTAMSRLHLTIISPTGLLYDGDIESVLLPGSAAPFTVLENHAPIITSLTKGTISFRPLGGGGASGDSGISKDAEGNLFRETDGGFAEISGNVVTLCLS